MCALTDNAVLPILSQKQVVWRLGFSGEQVCDYNKLLLLELCILQLLRNGMYLLSFSLSLSLSL